MKTQPKQTLGKLSNNAGVVKWYVIGGVLVAGALVTGIWYLSNKAKSITQKVAEKESLTEGTPESLAKLLKVALENWNVDEAVVFDVFSKISSKSQYQEIIKAYSRLTNGKLLNEDLENGMNSTELRTLMATLDVKADRTSSPQTVKNYSKDYAIRLQNAIYGFGTRSTTSDVIISVFTEIPNLMILEDTKKEYRILTGKDLLEDISYETDFMPIIGAAFSVFPYVSYDDKLKSLIALKK